MISTIDKIRDEFRIKLLSGTFVIDKTGVKTVDIIGAKFLANEPFIFGTPNQDYIRRELAWYESQSRNVYDIEEPVPLIWKKCASPEGLINSNYGWCIYSKENGSQYDNVLKELRQNSESRRGQMIYTRPSMHSDFNTDGMSDFMCCSNTTHFIRSGELETTVNFRSQDAVFGYNNDYAFMKYVHDKLANDLNIRPGNIHWFASSLHIYERHFKFIK